MCAQTCMLAAAAGTRLRICCQTYPSGTKHSPPLSPSLCPAAAANESNRHRTHSLRKELGLASIRRAAISGSSMNVVLASSYTQLST